MHSMGKTIAELRAMLKLHEKGIPKKAETPTVLAIREVKIQKDKKKPSNRRLREIIWQKTLSATTVMRWVTRGGIVRPTTLSRRRERMLASLVLQGLRGSKKLKHGALSLYVGNGMRAAVEVIGNNVFYFNAISRDGIYEIDMHNLYPNNSSMYNVSNKRSKHVLDSSYLWHCRLGHINKKRIDKLQRDGILQPTHDENLEKYKSCISWKMARKPFPHQVERAKGLLGLIHIDVHLKSSQAQKEQSSSVYKRVLFEQRNNPPQHPRVIYAPILDINYFRHFLDILLNYDPMDDEPVWAADRVVAPTAGSAITIPETVNEFAIKEYVICLNIKTENEAVHLMIFPLSITGEAKNWLDELNEGTIKTWDELRTAFISRFFPPDLFDQLLREIRAFS
ncbi:retrotransposon protein, putative, ty1-copia subclass [Tanacetum coccineum]